MPKLIVLGTSNAIPDERQENTHMVVVGKNRLLLIDCANNPIVRLQQAGLDLQNLTDLILTHFHPDHVSGAPSLLMNSWLLNRQAPLNIHGLGYTLDCLTTLMDFYGWKTWPGFYPVFLNRLSEEEMVTLLQDQEFLIYTSPVCHMVPNFGLRIEFPRSGKVMVYSSDTEPCPEVVRLARGADVLFHEATGATQGHSSAAQAGAIAQEAGVKSLYLIHYRLDENGSQEMIQEAQKTFNGLVYLAKDFMELEF